MLQSHAVRAPLGRNMRCVRARFARCRAIITYGGTRPTSAAINNNRLADYAIACDPSRTGDRSPTDSLARFASHARCERSCLSEGSVWPGRTCAHPEPGPQPASRVVAPQTRNPPRGRLSRTVRRRRNLAESRNPPGQNRGPICSPPPHPGRASFLRQHCCRSSRRASTSSRRPLLRTFQEAWPARSPARRRTHPHAWHDVKARKHMRCSPWRKGVSSLFFFSLCFMPRRAFVDSWVLLDLSDRTPILPFSFCLPLRGSHGVGSSSM